MHIHFADSPKHRRIGLWPVVLLPVFLAACGGSGDSPKAAQIDACKLIDPAAAGKIVGTTLTVKKQDTSDSPDNASICHFLGENFGTGFMLSVGQMNGSAAENAADAKKSVAEDFKDNANIDVTEKDISGLGDAAFVAYSGDFVQMLVYAGNNVIEVNRNTGGSDKVISETEKIAHMALDNLK